MKKGGLLLSDNTVMLFDNMTEEEGMKFLRHILNYHKTGIEPGEDTDRVILLSFTVFKGDYDISQDKYKAKVRRIEEINNRKKATSNEIVTTSHEIVTTSHDIVTTFEKSSPNTLHNNTIHNNKKESKPKKDGLSLSLSLSDRKEAFKKELEQYRNEYDTEMINDFFQYWTEPNKSNTKMRFEDQKFFKIKSRLTAWKNRKFSK